MPSKLRTEGQTAQAAIRKVCTKEKTIKKRTKRDIPFNDIFLGIV